MTNAYDALLPRNGGTIDLIAFYEPQHPVTSWCLTGGDLRPNNRLQQRYYGVKEHAPLTWYSHGIENAVNVVRLRAWYTDHICQAYAIDYCEQRLTPDDIAEIERQIRDYFNIPF